MHERYPDTFHTLALELTDMQGVRTVVSEAFGRLEHSLTQALSCWCMAIAASAPVTASRARIRILGNRLAIGAGRFHLESCPEVGAKRIGLWMPSYYEGHTVTLGATDRRLRSVVAQAPTISGYEQDLRRVAADALRFARVAC